MSLFDDLIAGSLLVDLNAANTSNLFSDAAKTTVVTDGVGLHTAALNGVDFVQSDAAKRLTFRSSWQASGYAGLEADGGDVLSGTDAAFGALDGRTVIGCVSCDQAQPAGAGTVVSIGSWWRVYCTGGTTFSMQASTGTPGMTVTRAAPARFVFVARSVGGCHRIDSGQDSEGNPAAGGPPTGNNDIDFGMLLGSSQPFVGAFHRVAVCDASLPWWQALKAALVLRYEWNVADPDPEPSAESGNAAAAFRYGNRLGLKGAKV